jgi:hypothetical protein
MFLKNTVEDILKNKEDKTEIIVGLDGIWSDPPLTQHPDVSVVYVPESVGQRGITNLCVKLSKARYVAKCDAHCGFDKGFDRKMIEFMEEHGDNVTAVPIMRNLWAFDWKCQKCGKKWYQGPTPTQCKEENYKGTGKPCDSKKFVRKMQWISKSNPQSWSYCFDSEPHFQYWEDYKHRPGIRDKAKETGFSETMSLQGSFFMCTREKYWELKLCGEELGSWGNQGLEVACATWCSGGRVLVNHKTFYSHMFRTQGADFSFPYEQSGKHVSRTKKRVKELFWNKKHGKQIYPVSWLLERFWPVKGWTDEDIAKLKESEKSVPGWTEDKINEVRKEI